MEERITQTAAAGFAEERQETTLRPQHLDDFIGQKTIKENLKIFIEAAKMRGEPGGIPLENTIFSFLFCCFVLYPCH